MLIVRRDINIQSEPDSLWHKVTDSDLYNRTLNLPIVSPILKKDDDDLNIFGTPIKLLGIKIGESLDPYIEWVKPVWFERERRMSNGPFNSLISRQELVPDENGTRVTYEMRLHTRPGFGWLVRSGLWFLGLRMERFLNILNETSVSPIISAESRAAGARSDTNIPFLDSRLAKLNAYHIEPDIIQVARKWLIEELDLNLQRIRPLTFARHFHIDPLSAIRFFLVGTQEGLFDLFWNIICPNCKGTIHDFSDLRRIKPHVHCETCRLDLRTNFDEAVEANFKPTAQQRKIDEHAYCYGFPVLTPHVLVQLRIKPKETRHIDGNFSGIYNAWVMPSLVKKQFEITNGHGSVTITQDDCKFHSTKIDTHLSVINRTDNPVMFQLQSPLIDPDVLTASKLTSLQDFRDLFNTQLLSPEVNLSVRHLVFMFTDLKSSTEMYIRMGDSQAFALVKDHFQTMKNLIRPHGGAIVKTIGDAIMAVFTDVSEAVATAIDIQKAFQNNQLVLKIGIHSGPSISITVNEILDYFGTTVNTAARVQSASQGGEIVLSDDVFNNAEIDSLIKENDIRVREELVILKGLKKETRIYFLTLPSREDITKPALQ